MKLAITGKGGVGKTTLASTLARLYADEGRTVLAADVDPDANLGLALGLSQEEVDAIVPISKMRTLVEERTGANAANKFFKLNPYVADIPDTFSKEINGVKLLVMGTVDVGGSGCVCPEHVMLKAILSALTYRKNDVVIIAGDFGGVWFGDSRDDETLDWLERLPFTLAFVCGNHENYDALERYPVDDWHGGKVHRIRPHVLHLTRGQIFELEGYRFFTMGGAKSHDIEDGILEPDAPDFERRLTMLQRKPRARYRVNHISWWAQELPSDEEYAEARRNLDAVGWQVDYIITHCAPTSIALMGTRHNEADRLTDFLQEVQERAKYHYWLFGHYHDNKAIDEKHILLWEQIVRVI